MADLNETLYNGGDGEVWTGWNQIEFWMDSVRYWTDRFEEFGDNESTTYAYNVSQAWKMVDHYLLTDC